MKTFFVVFYVLMVLFLNPWIGSDGAHYYAYLRSLFFDGDLNFYNEYAFYQYHAPWIIEWLSSRTETGYVVNLWAIGSAILWIPFFLMGHLWAFLAQKCGYPVILDGYSPPYVLSICLATFTYALLGMLFTHKMIKRYFPTNLSLLAVIGVVLASPLPAYIYREPSMSHTMEFFTISLYLYCWCRGREEKRIGYHLLIGLTGGLMTLVRWQNILFMGMPLLDFLKDFFIQFRVFNWKEIKRIFIGNAFMALCFMVAFSPQMISWRILYGSFMTMPQGGGFLQWFSPKIPQVLFSPFHGLFSWHPFLFVGAVGLVFFAKKDQWLTFIFLVVLSLEVYLSSLVPDWWGGSAFGMRRLVGCLPIFCIGYAAVLQISKMKQRFYYLSIKAMNLFFIIWNFLLMARVYDPMGDLSPDRPFIVKSLIIDQIGAFPALDHMIYNSFFPRPLITGIINLDYPLLISKLIFLFAIVIIFYVGHKGYTFIPSMLHKYWGKRPSQVNRINLTVAAIIIFIIFLDVILERTHWQASTIYTIDISNPKNFGKILPLTLNKNSLYQGSYGGIELLPGGSNEIYLTEHRPFRSLILVALLNLEGNLPQGTKLAELLVEDVSGVKYRFDLLLGRHLVPVNSFKPLKEDVTNKDQATLIRSWYISAVNFWGYTYSIELSFNKIILPRRILLSYIYPKGSWQVSGLALRSE